MSIAIHERPVLRDTIEGLRHHLHLLSLGRRGLAANELGSSDKQPLSFSGLYELAREFRSDDPSTTELKPKIDDTAELLLSEIRDTSSPNGTPRMAIGQNEVWDALKTWDRTRSAKTEALASYALKYATALSGHAALTSSFANALESGRSFDEELDRYSGHFVEK